MGEFLITDTLGGDEQEQLELDRLKQEHNAEIEKLFAQAEQ